MITVDKNAAYPKAFKELKQVQGLDQAEGIDMQGLRLLAHNRLNQFNP